MSIDEALAGPDPVGDIAERLMHKPIERMSDPEKVFWAVSYFVADALNGGLDQTMTNSTGDFIDVVGEFARRYGPPELVEVVADVHRLFPGGRAPVGREARIDAVASMRSDDVDPFEDLTTRFYRCEDAIRAGLLALVQRNRDAFDLDPAGRQGS